MEKQLTAQELYDNFYYEAVSRARYKGQTLPEEVEVFKIFVRASRKAVIDGEAPPDFMDEVAEVKPFVAREREEQLRLEQRDRALREGTVLDLDDLLK